MLLLIDDLCDLFSSTEQQLSDDFDIILLLNTMKLKPERALK